MALINCEVNLILTCSSACVISDSAGAGRFAITDIKLYVPVVLYELKIIQNCFSN